MVVAKIEYALINWITEYYKLSLSNGFISFAKLIEISQDLYTSMTINESRMQPILIFIRNKLNCWIEQMIFMLLE